MCLAFVAEMPNPNTQWGQNFKQSGGPTLFEKKQKNNKTSTRYDSVFSLIRLPAAEGADRTLGGSKDKKWGQLPQRASPSSSHRLWPPSPQLHHGIHTHLHNPLRVMTTHTTAFRPSGSPSCSSVMFQDFWFYLETAWGAHGSWSLVVYFTQRIM